MNSINTVYYNSIYLKLKRQLIGNVKKMTQEELNALIAQTPPWASEKTLSNMFAHMNTGNKNMRNIAAQMGDTSKADVDSIKSKSGDSSDASTKVSRGIEATAKQSQKTLKTLIGSSNPANAMAELGHEGAKLMSKAAGAVTSMIPGKFGAVASGVGKIAGYGAVAATGLAVVYGKLITEQEKYVRALFDFGSIAGDLDMYTTLRSSIRSLGMGLKEYAEITAATKPFLVSATGDVLKGQIRMSEFIRGIDNDKAFSDFGMTVQDQSRALAQEVQTLYELGQVEEFNAVTKKRVMGAFESVNKLAMFAGSSLGTTRMEALRLREEARSNVDFQMALVQNADFIKGKLGEEAAKNIDSAQGFMAILNESTFGAEMAEEFKNNVTATLGDISFDQSAANNIPKETLAKMQAIGPEVAQAYIKLVEDTATGQITTEAEAVERQRSFAKMIKDKSGTVAAFDPLLAQRNEIIAKAQLIPDSYFRADLDELRDSDYYTSLIDNADGAIDAIDDFSVTFQNIQEMLSPGFESTGKGFNVLTGGMIRLGNTVSKFWGDDDSNSFATILESQREQTRKDTLDTVNEDNIDVTMANVKQTYIRLDTQISTLDKAADLGVGANPLDPTETTELTDEEIASARIYSEQLREQKMEMLTFYVALLKKQTDLKAKEALSEIGEM